MIVDNPDLNITTEQKTDPETVKVSSIPGMSKITARWIVQGGDRFTVTVDSKKGGVVTKTR
jgi:hypothetical protein